MPAPHVTVSHASRARRCPGGGTERLAVDARHGEGRLAANGDAIGQAKSLQSGAELGVAPVVRIDDHPRDRETRLPNRPHLRQRDPPLLAKVHRRRQSSRGATRDGVGPRDGRYRSYASGHVRPSAISALDTAT